MEGAALTIYKAIAAVQDTIKNASTLDEALENCLRGFVEHSGAQGGVLWYADKADNNRMRLFSGLGR